MEIENVHTAERLRELQALPLDRKIQITQSRIIEWYQYWKGQVYVSFSGGKDSTVLLHIVRGLFPDIEGVYCDTGLEYPELKQFVKNFDNIIIIRPDMSFKQVIEQYGYPVISKRISGYIYSAKNNPNCVRAKYLKGEIPNTIIGGNGKYWYLVDAPFKISDYCCTKMKKQPLKRYQKLTSKHPYLGTMAEESPNRRQAWFHSGCNAFNNDNPVSNPMAFWTEQDVLEYIVKNNLKICSIYGDIIQNKKGRYSVTGEDRTGCMFCAYGCHLEKSPNRFERMKETHPKIWDYCIRPKDKGGLGMGEVLDFINVPYGKEENIECTERENDLECEGCSGCNDFESNFKVCKEDN